MMSQKTEYPTHQDILGNVLNPPLTELDALLWMVILHTHRIQLHPHREEINDGRRTQVLSPLTQRGAAEVIAKFWPDSMDQRANYTYWYWAYNKQTPYEILSQVPKELLPRLFELRKILAQDPRIQSIVEDD